MIKQIIEISSPAFVSLKDGQLVVEREHKTIARTPVEDLGILMLAHPGNVITQAALAACQSYGVAVVVCDEHYLPASLMLPMAGASLHAQTLRHQVAASEGVVDSLWQQIVAAKIDAQAALLTALGKPSPHLAKLAGRVRPGDSGHHESQAAAYYWRQLMGAGFRRDTAGPGANAVLNYGYAILRSAVARAIVGTGLCPAWGLFHTNRGDSYALADDLMEPLRPAVDECVWRNRVAAEDQLGPPLKRAILEILSGTAYISEQPLPLWVALQRYSASVKEVLIGSIKEVEIPKWRFSAVTEPCG